MNDEIVKKFAKYYGERNLECSSRELQLILRTFHYLAINLCTRQLKKAHIIPNDVAEMGSIGEFPFENIASMQRNEWESFVDVAEEMIADMIESMTFATKLRQEKIFQDIDYNYKQHMAWANIQINFPKIYVNQLQNVIYPSGYVVCFSTTSKDSAMWGNYADNHRGICFIYETHEDDEKHFMFIDSKKLEVKSVTYDNEVIKRNFFNTFGRLTLKQIETWLTGIDGSVSHLISTFSKEEIDSWRKQYWRDYVEKCFRKNLAWKHEQEYRVLLPNTFDNYHDKSKRVLQYKPSALKGIIFGINTTVEDKLRLIQQVKQRGDTFKDVEFFQAEYNDKTQEIYIRKKTYLI